jgi:hypothetical protein
MAEAPDHHIYSWVMFYTDTFRFYLEGVKFYARRLQGDVKAIQEDEDLKMILDQATLESMPIHKELSRVNRRRSRSRESSFLWYRARHTSVIRAGRAGGCAPLVPRRLWVH